MASSPHRVRPHIDSSSDQALLIYLSYTGKRQHCVHDETTQVYFSFFNPLKVTDELERKTLTWVHGSELGGGELAVGRKVAHMFPFYHIIFLVPERIDNPDNGRRKTTTNAIGSEDRLHPILRTGLHLQGIQAER